MIGRSEYIQSETGTSTTFQCSNCCPDSYNDGWLTPSGFYLSIGYTDIITFLVQQNDCYGTMLTPFAASSYWSSTSPLTIPEGPLINGEVTGISVGSGTVTGRIRACTYPAYPSSMCRPECEWIQEGAIAYVYDVEILSADITDGDDGKIEVFIDSDVPVEGWYKLELISSQGNFSLRDEHVTGVDGSVIDTFKISQLPTREFTSIRVTFRGHQDIFPYHFEVLGDYSNTHYNIPNEAGCDGPDTPFSLFGPGGCTFIPDCDKTEGWGRVEFVLETLENGSGHSISHDYIMREYFCSDPQNTKFRELTIDWGCPYCSDLSLTPDQTVAVHPNNNLLNCGDMVLVHGEGVRTVTDRGTGLSLTQLDHFSGLSACNSVSSIGIRKIIKLY